MTRADRARVAALVLTALLVAVVAGCSGPGARRDGPPADDFDASTIPDAVPRVEPLTKAGNKDPYVVFGKTYRLLPSSRGYREVGVASWYGTKFHGQHTANGEPYSLYAMTAAHPRLPIPCYVRVTNLDNGRSAIVRVNDRGPFHDRRVIDLSYAAAKKLGYANVGTARVEVVAIDPADYQSNPVEAPRIAVAPPLALPVPPAGQAAGAVAGRFLQVGAFQSLALAQSLRQRLVAITDLPIAIRPTASAQRTLFKVLIGPVADGAQLDGLDAQLRQAERLRPFVIYAGSP